MQQVSAWSLGRRDTVIDALTQAVAAWGDELFLEFSGTRYTYRELDRLSNAQAHALAELGVCAGQTVVMMMDNNIEAVVLWYAISKLLPVGVPINTAYKGEFLRQLITEAASEIVVCEHDYAPPFAPIAADLPTVRLILYRNTLESPLECVIPVEAGRELTEEELCRWSVDRIPYFAVPRHIEFREELPRSPVGRVLKHQLRAEGKTAITWDRDAADFKLVKL
jgi:crotonobetaine/carnitine-CoA ligase